MQNTCALTSKVLIIGFFGLSILFHCSCIVLFYNADLLELIRYLTLSLSYYGLAFDTTAILYVNVLFIVFSIFVMAKH
jgi:hypothetical protein